MQYHVLTKIPKQIEIHYEITQHLWPEFMHHDPVAKKNLPLLFEYFPEFQFSLEVDGDIIGTGNSVPYFWDKPFSQLSDSGWDWVIKKAVADYERGVESNTLNGLQIAISEKYQGQGISYIILKEMLALAAQNGYRYLTIPVRPSLKSQYPLISMENYMNWKREDGLPFDPWLRVHVKAGGVIIKLCSRSMYISGSIVQWEQWTGLKFLESNEYIIRGALNPMDIDLKNNLGEYVEPNIWVLHKAGKEKD